MSRITNIILLSFDKKENIAIQNLNKFFVENNYGNFEEISRHAGGFKVLGAKIYSICCNYFRFDSFIECFEDQKWEYPLLVRLLINEEGCKSWDTFRVTENKSLLTNIHFKKYKSSEFVESDVLILDSTNSKD